MPFGIINRFAGDNLQNLRNSLSKGYGAIDGQFGGILPGAAKPNVGDLAKSMVIESLPGSQPSPLDKQNKIINKGVNATKDIAEGDVLGAASRSHGGTRAGKVRERVAEYGGRKLIRGGASAIAGSIGTAIAPGVALYEGADLARGLYSDYLSSATGKSLNDHYQIARNKRPEARALNELFPEARHIGTTDGSTPEWGQGKEQNPVMQEAKARLQDATQSFNPAQGDFGITELFYGR
jgi:hypothetical protein